MMQPPLPADPLRLRLSRLEESLRLAGAQERDTVELDGFTTFFAPVAHYHMSFAVPHATTPESWADALAELKDTFSRRERRARLEYFLELHPELATALEAAGFQQDMQAPVMTLDREALSAPPPERGGDYRLLRADSGETLKTFLRRQSTAFSGTGSEDNLGYLPQLLKGLERGNLLAAALTQADEIVSGAIVQIGGDVGELVGVWTASGKTKQGLAFEVCQHLLADYFTLGYELAWLSAAEGAEHLYEKLGFVRVGTQLNYGLPE